MEIVKKNLVSIICGVVALAALVAAFVWPLDGYFTDLKGRVDKRAALEKKVQALINKPRTLPVFTNDPSKPDGDRLTKFPSREIISKGNQAQKAVRTQSEKAYDTAWRMNNEGHGLVSEGSLPRPLSDSIAISFRSKLQAALDQLRTQELLAGVPPTDEELKNRKGQIWADMQKKFIIVADQVKNQEAVMKEYNAAIAKLPDLMKEEMATKWKMYIDPLNVMRVPDYIPADGRSPDPNQIWWAQVAFWVTHDVAAAIQELNANSHTVTTSPVKNLVMLNIPDTFFPPMTNLAAGGGAGRGGSDDAGATSPTGGLPDPAIAIPDGAAQSPTKRISNNLFDVVQFRLVLDIEAAKVPMFLKALATNRFLSVIRLEMNPVDSQLKQIQGYVYGNKPVVTLDLDCEAVLMRQWTIKYMPKGRGSIREMLGIPDEQSNKTAMGN